ncbi:MAG: hypothetical protein SFX73_24530 [Kofleriaceae bacterium]|nr:hypothetical protein [Kofleriaceae bacterium]
MRCALLVAAFACVACGDADPGSPVSGPRIIAVVASPPTIAVDGTTRLSVVTAIDGFPVPADAVAWRACSPYALVVDPVRDCTGETALALAADAEGHAVLDVAALAARFAIAVPSSSRVDDPCGEQVLPVSVVVEAELGGARLIAVKTVEIGVAPAARTNPVVLHGMLGDVPLSDGAVVDGGRRYALGAEVDPATRDLVCVEDEVMPTRRESVEVYALAGGGAVVRGNDIDVEDDETNMTTVEPVELELPSGPAMIPLWLVGIDRNGGVGVRFLVLDVR